MDQTQTLARIMEELPKALDALLLVALLGTATGIFSVTLTLARVFRPLRKAFRTIHPWLGKLISCPYCTSHWIAAFFTVVYRPVVLPRYFLLDLFVSWGCVIFVACCAAGLTKRAMEIEGDPVEPEDPWGTPTAAVKQPEVTDKKPAAKPVPAKRPAPVSRFPAQ